MALQWVWVVVLSRCEEVSMKLWHRLLVVLVAMLTVSFLAGRLWFAIFEFALPSYLAGVVGGFTALPVWEILRRLHLAHP